MLGEYPDRDHESADTSRTIEAGQRVLQTTRVTDGSVNRYLWYRDWLLSLTIASVLIIDQGSKYLVRANLALRESWPQDGLVRLTHGTNSGTAFGLFPNQTTVLIVASFFAIGFLYYFYRSQALPSRVLRLAIGMQLGGAFGNLIDRLRGGFVTDFIDVGWWPIFNLADSSIVVGIGLLLAAVLLGREPKLGDRHTEHSVSLTSEPDDSTEDPHSEPHS